MFGYQTLTVPEEDGANVLYINGTLVHRSEEEVPESCKVDVSVYYYYYLLFESNTENSNYPNRF